MAIYGEEVCCFGAMGAYLSSCESGGMLTHQRGDIATILNPNAERALSANLGRSKNLMFISVSAKRWLWLLAYRFIMIQRACLQRHRIRVACRYSTDGSTKKRWDYRLLLAVACLSYPADES